MKLHEHDETEMSPKLKKKKLVYLCSRAIKMEKLTCLCRTALNNPSSISLAYLSSLFTVNLQRVREYYSAFQWTLISAS